MRIEDVRGTGRLLWVVYNQENYKDILNPVWSRLCGFHSHTWPPDMFLTTIKVREKMKFERSLPQIGICRAKECLPDLFVFNALVFSLRRWMAHILPPETVDKDPKNRMRVFSKLEGYYLIFIAFFFIASRLLDYAVPLALRIGNIWTTILYTLSLYPCNEVLWLVFIIPLKLSDF